MNNFDFDLGIGSGRSKSLNDQKNKTNTPYSYMSSSSTSSYSQSKPGSSMPSWQPGKPSWTHQPAASVTGMTRSELGGPTSMVGDIFGKSWGSTTPAKSGQSSGVNVGVVNGKNPNLFGDLVGAALGGGKSGSNVPLKSAGPVNGSFSMGGMTDSLPKTTNAGGNVGKNAGLGTGFGNSQSFGGVSSSVYGSNGVNKSSSMGNMGGDSMKNVGGTGGHAGIGMGMGKSSNKDPFGSLVDFSMKPMSGGTLNSGMKAATASTSTEDFGFGNFQNASKSSTSTFPSGNRNNSWGADLDSVPGMDSFASQKTNPAPVQQSSGGGGDSFDMFFSASVGSGGTAASVTAAGGQQFSGGDDWGFESEYGGGHDEGSTTELEGLPPPPAGVSASTAKSKGLDNYKQGQFADAIKWLSWAEVLLEKAAEISGTMEVLTCRASCYKEVGEYKKAVADCTKVLDHDGANVSVLVQRALLYESMEKYRLGADDLRTVMKLDPSNRVARSTIHRLNKLAD